MQFSIGLKSSGLKPAVETEKPRKLWEKIIVENFMVEDKNAAD